MLNTLLVMIGGAIGAALRYQLGHVSLRLMGPGYPWGTLAVNVLGSFIMGLVTGWLALRYDGSQAEQLRLLIAVGVLGGFTTFSAFSLDAFLMMQRGEWLSMFVYISASVIASIGALALGLTIMRGVTA
jgi:CrcB protein